jgi:hypothetical protein
VREERLEEVNNAAKSSPPPLSITLILSKLSKSFRNTPLSLSREALKLLKKCLLRRKKIK